MNISVVEKQVNIFDLFVQFGIKTKNPVFSYIAFKAFLALRNDRAPETWCGTTKNRRILIYKHILVQKTSFGQKFGPNVVYYFLNIKYIQCFLGGKTEFSPFFNIGATAKPLHQKMRLEILILQRKISSKSKLGTYPS